MLTTYSDISPRTQVYADRQLLIRARPQNVVNSFGQVRTLPTKKSDTVKFRRYNSLLPATQPIAEGVTPTGSTVSVTDVTVTVQQYGDYVIITDKIRDMHEDPVLNENIDILAEHAADTWDILTFNVIKAGTNVSYTNGAARNVVNTIPVEDDFLKVVQTLKGQNAKKLTEVIKSGTGISTEPISASYVSLSHTDMERDLEKVTGYVPVAKYSTLMGLIPGEIGASGQVRFVTDTNLVAFPDAGGTKGTMFSTTGVNADVYPMIILGKNAFGIVPLAGKTSATVLVSNPRPQQGDPLSQRGTVGWKGYHAAVILNDNFMHRLESARTA